MPRAVTTDFLLSMRFHVSIMGANNAGYLLGGNRAVGTGVAGFTACSTPELSSEAVEYKEGQFIYPRKFPGNPSVSDITLSRGVARQDSSFWLWMQASVEGGALANSGTYREDVQIDHYHRDKAFAGGPNIQVWDTTADPGRRYLCYEAFPIRHKSSSDLDATASEISIMELDVAMEYFKIEEIAP